ncbi:ABC transporter permease [Virgibacillus soli]|uniref:ABC transporter permease n=1 Tax=Paracerasibacillus soli TaxID=480284 RepID=UPI0035E5A6DC
MLKLIYNEQMKMYIRKSTWIMYILLAVIIVGFAFLMQTADETVKYTEENWQAELQKENEQLLAENAKETEEFLIEYNMEIMAENNYYLEHDIKPPNEDTWYFLRESAGLLSLVSLFTIIIGSSIVANEFRWGTIKLLLIRPISRSKNLLSKYISVLLFALTATIFTFIISLLIGSILFGFDSINPIAAVERDGQLIGVSIANEAISDYAYNLVNLVMMTTFAFMISVLFRNSTLAIGLAIFLMMAGNTIVAFFAERSWAKYILFANTDLKSVANGTMWLEGMTLPLSLTILAIYYTAFMALSWIVFTKRDVAGQ